MSIISNSPTIGHERGTSRPQNTAVGSGSRPTKSKVMIETSAPKDACGLDGRKTAGALGYGGKGGKY